MTSPPFAAVLLGVANLLLDMYAPVLGQSAAIDELFVKLRTALEAEMRLQAELSQLMGAMDVLLAGAMPTGQGGMQAGRADSGKQDLTMPPPSAAAASTAASRDAELMPAPKGKAR